MGNLNKKPEEYKRDDINNKKLSMINTVMDKIQPQLNDDMKYVLQIPTLKYTKYRQEVFINPKERVNYSSETLNERREFMDIYKSIINKSLVDYFTNVNFITTKSDEMQYMCYFINEFWLHVSHNYYGFIESPLHINIGSKLIATHEERKEFNDKYQKIISSTDFDGDKLNEFKYMTYSVMLINNMTNVKKDVITKFYDKVIASILKNRILVDDKSDDIYRVLCPDNGGLEITTDTNN